MSTRRGSYAHRAPEHQDRIKKYNEFVTAYFGNKVPVENNKRSTQDPITFYDGTDPNDEIEYFTPLPPGDVKYSSIKFKLRDLVDDRTYNYINSEFVNKFHYMKLKLSKLLFGFIIFKYGEDLNSLIEFCRVISITNAGLTDFITSMANAMNGNYKHQSGKETWLDDFDVLSFIVDYMGQINGTNNRINPDEIILKNRSSFQTIQYIADQMSVNIKNCIKNNIKILIRIYIEYKMEIKSEKKKIRREEKDISKRNDLRTVLYTQRKIIQSVIFEYPIEDAAKLKRQHTIDEITDARNRTWVFQLQATIRRLTLFEPKLFYKTLKSKPLICLPFAIWLKRQLLHSYKAKKIALLPIIGFKSCSVSHIKLDTTCILSSLFHSRDLNIVADSRITAMKSKIWSKFFSDNGLKMLRRVLKRKHFIGEIITNGYSCSLTFGEIITTPAPILSKFASKPFPSLVLPANPPAANPPTVAPTVVPTPLNQPSEIPTESNQQNVPTTSTPTLVAISNSNNSNNSNSKQKRKSVNISEDAEDSVGGKNNASPVNADKSQIIPVAVSSSNSSSSNLSSNTLSTTPVPQSAANNKKKKANESNKRKLVSSSGSTVNPTSATSSKEKKTKNNLLSHADKQKLDIANVLYSQEVDDDDYDENLPFDRQDKFKSIKELEDFADQSYRDKNAPFIPYIHQLSNEQKNAIINHDNLAIGAEDLGIRDIFKMLTIKDQDKKFLKPTSRNSTILSYSSKHRAQNLQIKVREKRLDIYKKKKFVEYEGKRYTIKQFESSIVRKQLRFTDTSYENFITYSKNKSKFESVLKKFHESTYVKSLKHQAYESKQNEYCKIAKRIKEKLGRKQASDCLLIVGDVSISTHLKGNRPANWKGMTRYLKKYGFKILRIEEYHSSKLCCNCRKFNTENKSNENWLTSRRTYGKQKGKMLPVYSLFKCACCRSIKQRDVNAVVNMYENGINQLHSRTMNEFVIPEGVRENWLLNSRNYSHTAFKDKYRCY